MVQINGKGYRAYSYVLRSRMQQMMLKKFASAWGSLSHNNEYLTIKEVFLTGVFGTERVIMDSIFWVSNTRCEDAAIPCNSLLLCAGAIGV